MVRQTIIGMIHWQDCDIICNTYAGCNSRGSNMITAFILYEIAHAPYIRSKLFTHLTVSQVSDK
jgi:hypothetical protein